jgi:hypothetical protein
VHHRVLPWLAPTGGLGPLYGAAGSGFKACPSRSAVACTIGLTRS